MKTDSRTKNAKRNIAWGVIQRFISILLDFLVKNAMIYFLGTVYLGLNGLYSSILHVLSLTELGFGEAMVFSMYKPLAEDDQPTVRALLNLFRKIYRIIGAVILVIGTAILPLLPKLIKDQPPQDINIYILYLVYLVNTAVSYLLFAYKGSLLTASQRSDVTNNVTIFTSITLKLMQIALLALFRNYYIYCVLIPIMTVVRSVVINFATKKMYPQYYCEGEIGEDMKEDIKKRVTGAFIYKVCSVFRSSFDSIILSAFLGLTVLAKYDYYFYIMSSLVGIFGIIESGITASVGNSLVTESKSKNYGDFKKFLFIYMWITAWCTVCLFNLYQPFIRTCVKPELLFENGIMAVFCVYFFTKQMGNMAYIYRQAAGIWYQDRYRPIVESVVNLTLNIVLVKTIGVAGVLLSTIICLVFINCIWGSRVLFRTYFTDEKNSDYFIRLIGYALITAAGCAATGFVNGLLPLTGFAELAVKAAVCCVLPNLLFLGLFRAFPERKDAFEFARGLVKKNR